MTPEALETLTPEERHRFYMMLGLKVIVGADGSLEIDGTFIADGLAVANGASGEPDEERTLVSTKTAD